MRIRRQDLALLAQAVAIVLPVVALSGIALHFLQEDRAAIDREAQRRAQSELPADVAALQQEVRSGIDHAALIGTIRNGSFWIPGDYSPVPEPSGSEALAASQLQLLETSNSPDAVARAVTLANRTPASYRMPSVIPIRVRAVEFALRHTRSGLLPPNVLGALESTIRECPGQAQELLQLAAQVSGGQPSARLAAIQLAWRSGETARRRTVAPRFDAYVGLQLLEAAEKRHAPDVIARSIEVATRAPASVTPAGTPIAPLALLIGLRHSANGELSPQMLAAIEDQVANHASFLTTALVNAAGQTAKGQAAVQVAAIADAWKLAEDDRERKRALFRSVAAQLVGLSGPSAVLPAGPRGEWLALCDRLYDGWSVRVIPNLKPRTPNAYLGLTVDIDQQRWRLAGRAKSNPHVLASSSGRLDGATQHSYAVTVDLADPDQLYHPYRSRLLWTRLLIFSAAVTALIGLASLWTSFLRQTRLSEMKSNFVSSVSHELRAPLAALRLMGESLDSGRVIEEEKRRDYYRLIVQECGRLSRLVENVLDISRVGDGHERFHFEQVELAALLRQSVAIMEPHAAERQVTLRLAADAGAGLQPRWDAAAVEQSLVNLLDNAIKHSPAGSAVNIGVEQADGKIRIWVEDSGPGIPLREQKRIFELFYRLGTELRRETKGAGIGLAIVRSVADAHGGRVMLASEVEQGSRFTLELPMERPA